MTIYKWKVEYIDRVTNRVIVIYTNADIYHNAEKLAWEEFVRQYGEAFTKPFYVTGIHRLGEVK